MANGVTSPLWLTTDGGLSWSPVVLPVVSGMTSAVIGSVTWHETLDQWAISLPAGWSAALYRGKANQVLGTRLISIDHNWPVPITSGGPDSFFLSYLVTRVGGQSAEWKVDGTFTTFAGVIHRYNHMTVERLLGTNSAVIGLLAGHHPGALYSSANYQTTTPTSTGLGGSSVTVAQDGVYLATSTGIQQVTGLPGAATATVVAAAGVNVLRIRADRQTQQQLGAVNASKNLLYLRAGLHETWETVAIPGVMMPAAKLANTLEVTSGGYIPDDQDLNAGQWDLSCVPRHSLQPDQH